MNMQCKFLHIQLAKCALLIALIAAASLAVPCDVARGQTSSLPRMQWDDDRLFDPPLQRAAYPQRYPLAHTPADVDETLEAARRALRKV